EAVLAEHHHAHPAGFKEASEIPDDTVDVAEIADDFRDIWAEALQVVVEVGQVDEVQMRRVAFLKPLRGPRNPFTRGDAGGWPPKGRKGEGAEILSDRVP